MRSVFSKIRAAEQSGSLYGALAIAGAGTAAMLYLREQNDVALRQELDAVRAARKGDAVDGSKLERGPIVLDKPEDGDEKTIDSID